MNKLSISKIIEISMKKVKEIIGSKSKDVEVIEYTKCNSSDSGALLVVADGTLTDKNTQVEENKVVGIAITGEYVLANTTTKHKDSTGIYKYIDDKMVSEGGLADWTTNITVGGLEENTDLTDLNSIEILNKITRAYVNPSATITWSQVNTIIEEGTNFNLDITVNGFVKGDFDPTKISFYRDGALVEELNVADLTTTLSFATINNVNSNSIFEVKITDANNVEGLLEKKEYIFVNASYVGSVDTIPTTDTEITALTKLLRTKANLTQSFNVINKHIVFAYPSDFGDLTSILDGNNFENITDFNKTNININGIGYNVYTTNGKKTLTNFNYTFKY